jgi:hypothetical protein
MIGESLKNEWVVVSDTSRGLSYGRLVAYHPEVNVAELAQRRHIRSFVSKTALGVWGLVVTGPSVDSEITAPAEGVAIIAGVSKIVLCSSAAVEAFNACPSWTR